VDAIDATGFITRDEYGNPVGTGIDGVRGFIKWLALYEPKTAAALLARVLPYYITTAEVPPVASRAEIEAEFKECGLPLGLIDHLQVAPAPLDPGESAAHRKRLCDRDLVLGALVRRGGRQHCDDGLAGEEIVEISPGTSTTFLRP
jgi:hypothetical protein